MVQVGAEDVKRLGVEGEIYFPNFSVLGGVGYQSAEGDVEDDLYGLAGVRWYMMDNLE